MSRSGEGDLRLREKICLVTGARGGIGSAIVDTFLREGATVVASDLRVPTEEDATVSPTPGAVSWQEHDVTIEENWQRVIAFALDRFGRLDVLVNNAGIAQANDIEAIELSDWQNVLRVNLDGVFIGLKHGIGAIKESGGGSIVNVSSVAGIVGSSTLPAYCASKGGVIALTKSAALHCLERNYSIRVNAVCPSFADTPMVDGIASGTSNEARFKSRLERSVPYRRLASAQEVADGVLYLASDESSYVSGSSLVIDGGLTAA